MTALFLVHSEQDTACVTQIRSDLVAQGYVVAEESAHMTEAGERRRVWEQAMQSSSAVILVWSAAAEVSASVAQQLDYAQWLYKRLLVLALDSSTLPDAMASTPTVRSTPPCADAAAQLRAHLPPPQDQALLNSLLAGQPGGEGARLQPATAHGEAQHIFGVRCPDGHISYFDKREVCRPQGMIKRIIRDGKELTELRLPCTTCTKPMVVDVDCEGYK